MKLYIIAAVALFVAMQSQAQEKAILSRPFWQGNPDLSSVKTEIGKGFNYSEVKIGDDPLSLAISKNASIEVIKYLADLPGIDFKRGIHEGRTYLHAAASKGNADACDYLLKKGADMYYADAHGQTALTYAGFMGNMKVAVLEAFVKNGLDVKKKYETKDDANIWLLGVGGDKDMAITNYLIGKGVPLQSVDRNGNTAFDYAAKQGNVTVLKALLQKGVKHSDNALLMAAAGPFRTANKIDVFQYLVDEVKINPAVTNSKGQNVLHLVVSKQNQSDIITYFFNKGVDINKVDNDGGTPFIGAAGTKSLETVALLLPKVKDINAANAKGETALMNAVKSSTAEVVELLLKNGANLKALDKEENGIGFYLIESYRGAGGRGGFGGRQQTVAGGNAGGLGVGEAQPGAVTAGRNRGGGQGEGSAANTAAQDFTAKVKVLQAKGFDFNRPQKDGNSLYHLAIVKNDVVVLKQLAALGIDINAKNKEGYTALHKAAMLSKNDAVLKYLVEAGASKSIKTSFDETAYQLAEENTFINKDNAGLDFLK